METSQLNDEIAMAEDTLPAPMPLTVAWLHYFACVAFFAMFYVGYYRQWYGLTPLAFVWLLQGVWLNKKVLPRVIVWHPIYNTLGNVVGDKLRFALLWPIHYAILLGQLTINRML